MLWRAGSGRITARVKSLGTIPRLSIAAMIPADTLFCHAQDVLDRRQVGGGNKG